MKKLMFLLLASVLLLSACSGGGGNASSDPGKKEITVWAWDQKFNIAALNLAKEKYMAAHPDVTINIVENAQADIVQKLNTGLNSGTTKGLPNIVLIEDYRSQGFLQAYPDAFRDMSASIKAADFADYKAGPTSYQGKQYGVPFDSGVTGLYVRTDYLEQAGYKVADLQDIDWDQFIEIGKKVKAATGKDMLTQDPNDLGLIRSMIQSSGSWYLKEDGTTPNIAGNAALKKALETYKAMYDANIIKANSDWSQFLAAFNSGAVASVPTGNWITPSIKAEASQSGKWAVVPFPVLKDVPNSVHASNIGGASWYVMNVDGQDTAADFLKSTFGSDKDLYQDMLTNIGIIGTLKTSSENEAYDKPDEFFGGQKVYADFAKWTKEVPNVNYGLHTYAIEDIMTVEVQNYLSGSKDVDTMMNDVQAQAEAQLK